MEKRTLRATGSNDSLAREMGISKGGSTSHTKGDENFLTKG